MKARLATVPVALTTAIKSADEEAAGLLRAVMAALPDPPTLALGRLADRLARLGVLLGRHPRRPVHSITWVVQAWLASAGVTAGGTVPADLVMWMIWADGLRDPRPALVRVPPGWQALTIDAALVRRMHMQGSAGGTWLPLVDNGYGDHHVYTPQSSDAGTVGCQYHDEHAPGGGTLLVDYARSLLDAWSGRRRVTTGDRPRPRPRARTSV